LNARREQEHLERLDSLKISRKFDRLLLACANREDTTSSIELADPTFGPQNNALAQSRSPVACKLQIPMDGLICVVTNMKLVTGGKNLE
jgi:hypothetical protein